MYTLLIQSVPLVEFQQLGGSNAFRLFINEIDQ